MNEEFGTTCVDCGEPIDDSRPYGHTADGDLIHVGCGEPLPDYIVLEKL